MWSGSADSTDRQLPASIISGNLVLEPGDAFQKRLVHKYSLCGTLPDQAVGADDQCCVHGFGVNAPKLKLVMFYCTTCEESFKVASTQTHLGSDKHNKRLMRWKDPKVSTEIMDKACSDFSAIDSNRSYTSQRYKDVMARKKRSAACSSCQ